MGVVPTLCDRELNMYVIKTLQSKTGGGGEKRGEILQVCAKEQRSVKLHSYFQPDFFVV